MPDGKATLRQTYESGARQNPIFAKALKGPLLPETMEYLWSWFTQLHNGRTDNGIGRATHQDMIAWMQLSGVQPNELERRALMSLGTLWVNVNSEDIATVARPKNG